MKRKELEKHFLEAKEFLPTATVVDFQVAWGLMNEIESLMAENEKLKEKNGRLIQAALGRGMVSEMADMEETAVLVCGLHDKLALANSADEIEALVNSFSSVDDDGLQWMSALDYRLFLVEINRRRKQ